MIVKLSIFLYAFGIYDQKKAESKTLMKLTPDLQFETELELISQDSRHRILRRIRRRRENSRPMNSEISYRSR
jgi:hypothetical protein